MYVGQKTSPRRRSIIPAAAIDIPNIAGLPDTGVSGNGASVGVTADNGADVGVTVTVATAQTQFVLSVHDAFLHDPLLEQIYPEVQSVSVEHAELHPGAGVGLFVGLGVWVGVWVTVPVGVWVGVWVTVPVGVWVGVWVLVIVPLGVAVGVGVSAEIVNWIVHAADTALGFCCGTFGATGVVCDNF
jgi:hypothetical protein